MKKFSHIDKQGNAKMVDISNKQKSFRIAKACATISMNNDTISLIQSNEIPKGNVFTTAKIADGAVTTATASQLTSPPVSKRRGTSKTTSDRLCFQAIFKNT